VKAAGRIAGLLLGLLAAALLLGAIVPRNPGRVEPVAGIDIGIDATLAHTELVLPVAANGHDWRRVLPPELFPPGLAVTHLSFSWGERDFFLATPEWSDIDLRLAVRALAGSSPYSLVHVYRMGGPAGRRLRLSPQEHARLVQHIEAEIGAGRMRAGYGPDDFFLPGTRRYSALDTCNQWVADALAAAGVTVGHWTPFAQSIMWRFEG
jgi:uncharacterized protein (TIGR02117 family)